VDNDLLTINDLIYDLFIFMLWSINNYISKYLDMPIL